MIFWVLQISSSVINERFPHVIAALELIVHFLLKANLIDVSIHIQSGITQNFYTLTNTNLIFLNRFHLNSP